MKKKAFLYLTLIISVSIVLHACKKDEPAKSIDMQLLDMATETSGFTWFKNSDAWLDRSSGSGHHYILLRTRYNGTAATQLDGDGKVVPNASFPDGSLVVKEMTNGTSVELYAILYKQSDNEFADANGWVWGYLFSNGNVATSAEDKGAICTSCHSQSESIDYMLMNKYFP